MMLLGRVIAKMNDDIKKYAEKYNIIILDENDIPFKDDIHLDVFLLFYRDSTLCGIPDYQVRILKKIGDKVINSFSNKSHIERDGIDKFFREAMQAIDDKFKSDL